MSEQDLPNELRYDRQLRLWGAGGQQLLECSHVMLLNCGTYGPVEKQARVQPPAPRRNGDSHGLHDDEKYSSGLLTQTSAGALTETLKNLVLAGIGKYTIVDPGYVTEEDVNANFFLTPDCIGRPRAESIVEALAELNPDVEGGYLLKYPFEREYNGVSLVIAAGPIPPGLNRRIQHHCKIRYIPYIVVHSYGFFGTCSIQMRDGTFFWDTHQPIRPYEELRIGREWPELRDFHERFTGHQAAAAPASKGHDSSSAETSQAVNEFVSAHSLTYPPGLDDAPASVVLSYFAQIQVNEARRAGNPKATVEWIALGQRIESISKSDNFSQASTLAYKIRGRHSLPEQLESLFMTCIDSDQIAKLIQFTRVTAGTVAPTDLAYSWIAIRALRKFFCEHGQLPLPGSIPDMVTSTEDSVELQRIYQEKALRERNELHRYVGHEIELVNQRQRQLNNSIFLGPMEDDFFYKVATKASIMRYVKGWEHRALLLWDIDAILRSIQTVANVQAGLVLPPSDYPIHKVEAALAAGSISELHDLELQHVPDHSLAIYIAVVVLTSALATADAGQVPPASPAGDPDGAVMATAHFHATVRRVADALLALLESQRPEPGRSDKELPAKVGRAVDELVRPLFLTHRRRQRAGNRDGQQTAVGLDKWATDGPDAYDDAAGPADDEFTLHIPELHVTASAIGGIASQEAIKVLTGQFVSSNSTIVWDGIHTRIAVLNAREVLV